MNTADFQAQNPYATFGTVAAHAPADARVAFIKRTYWHLALAIYALVGIVFCLFQIPGLDNIMGAVFATRWGWLLVLGAFILVGNLAERWAQSATSIKTQYLGLITYVVAQAVILMPLLWIANKFTTDLGGGVQASPILVAGVLTLLLFGGLTAAVLLTKQDFSFLAPALSIAGLVALGLIVLSALGIMNLGIIFMAAMVVFASGYTLYYTSQVLHHYRTDQHVAASLALFASVTLMFWYILQIVLRFSSDD
jgi:FtsH-binding integral membrane protein